MDLQFASHILLWVIVAAQAIAIIVVIRVLGTIMLGSREAIERDGLPIGADAPNFVGHLRDGEPFALSGNRSTWVALIFASPACSICRSLLPDLTELSDEFRGTVDFLVLLRGSIEDARLFSDRPLGNLEVVAIGAEEVANAYRVRVSPYLVVLDAKRTVQAKGLVNERRHVEHFLADAGLRDPLLASHLHERASGEVG